MSRVFATLPTPEPDAILKIMGAFRADPRPDKIDLGVGVYRDAAGATPIMAAVRAAEARIAAAQTTKGYVALSGDPEFRTAVADLVFGAAPGTLASAATPGGTGAVRQGLELVRKARPSAQVWVSAPTWPNHETILDEMGMPWRAYRYYDPETGGLDLPGMLADLETVPAGDVVLLHACCHNPTGADLTPAHWTAVAELLRARGILPFIDMAYLGFAEGVETDPIGIRQMAEICPELLVAFSGSKSFGLYRERVGAIFAHLHDAAHAPPVAASLESLNRHAYAFPPDHGARVVTEILADPTLRALWQAELDEMRQRIADNRTALAEALREVTGTDRFGFLAAHRGMFSRLPATPAQVEGLRADHGIYTIGDGRINLAGLTAPVIPRVAEALAKLLP